MKVIKIGGGCLKGKEAIRRILELIAERGQGQIFVVSALHSVTDFLIHGMQDALEEERNIPAIISHLKDLHTQVAGYLISDADNLERFKRDFARSLNKLERLYYGLNFTKEITPRMYDVISSFGERFSAELLAYALRCLGFQATYRMPHAIGLLTDGKFGDATANMTKTTRNLQLHLTPLVKKEMILFIPGFFGVSEGGDITTFGRGGTDYSAAVIAAAMQADILEIWKDVDGFMTADPHIVGEAAQLIPTLSYEEAAELAYFGAKILHPRTMEPVRRKKINIAIKNTINPDAPGSLISSHTPKTKRGVKSVAHSSEISILKIHSSGVGARPGILADVASHVTQKGINIKSVVTSQTCISLLLESKDLDPGYQAIKSLRPKPYRRLERLDHVAIIGIVGEGLIHRQGVAAKCFSAVAECNINIEMISMGPSSAALYCIVHNEDLDQAVRAIHDTFFNGNED